MDIKKVLLAVVILLIVIILLRRHFFTLQNKSPFSNVWSDKNADGVVYQKVMETMLQDLSDILKEKNIPMMPMYGTLLGMVRHQTFVPWDDDVDVCIPKEHFVTLMNNREKLREMGLGIYKVPFVPFVKIYSLSSPKTFLLPWRWPFIDVFSYEVIDERVRLSDTSIFKTHYFSKDDIFPLKSNKIHSVVLSMPNNPDAILNRLYGNNWETTCVSSSHNHRAELPYRKTYSTKCANLVSRDSTISVFDNAWVINLDRREDRWNSTKNRLDAIGVSPKRWSATDAKTKEFIKYYNRLSQPKRSINEIACLNSHVDLWKHLIEKDVETAMIFEDDILIGDGVDKDVIIEKIRNSSGFDVLFLGHCHATSFWFDKPTVKPGSALCLNAYVITKNAMQKLVDMVENKNNIPIDWVVKKYCSTSLCYISSSHPLSTGDYYGEGAVYQDESLFSDLRDFRRII